MRGVLMMVGLLLATTASAQTKPIGLFDPGPNPPAWASFGTIPDTSSDDRLRDAAALSRARGFKWVLQLGYHEHPATPIGPHAARVRARLEAAGLLPHVLAMSVGEEWYEYWLAGEFARYGLAADNPAGVHIIRDWLGRQHLAAQTALGLPTLWITTVASHRAGAYRPIPDHTNFVALDPYIPEGGSFALNVAPILRLAEESTTLPLVLVPQWFRAPGFATPSPVDAALYRQWLTRPQWVAMLGFTWRDRPWLQMQGLEGLPALRDAVERSLGVK